MKTIITFLLILCALNIKAQQTYNPLKKNYQWRQHLKDTAKVRHIDTVFVGLFYCPTAVTPYYAVYQLYSNGRKKWQPLRVTFNPQKEKLPVQFYYMVTDSTITDPSKGIQQLIKTSP